MKHYDLAFGIGAACSCTEILRKAGLQFLTFPFDWLYGASFLERARMLASDGENWLVQSALQKQSSPEWHDKDNYRNALTGISFNHDFPKGVSLEQSFPSVARKYERRFSRLRGLIASSKNVLVVYIATPGVAVPDAEISVGLKVIQDRFPNAVFDLMLFRIVPGVAPANKAVMQIGEHIRVVEFDYKDPKPGRYDYLVEQSWLIPCFAGISVRDYRTAEETRAHERARRLARYSKYGATNFFSFTIRRLKYHAAEAARFTGSVLSLAWKRLRARRLVHQHSIFISLGYNCELAFRYFKSNGFVDSGLFQWANSGSIDRLTYAIEHLDLLYTGEIRDPNPIYQCANTLIWQHGKALVGSQDTDGAAAQVDLEADREDLRGRIAHLKEKFVKNLRKGGALVAYKVRTAEYFDPLAEEKLNRLIAALRNLGMREATLLLVCEEACSTKSIRLDWPDAHVRYVKSFNPDAHVTDAELGDSVGWHLIFDEFRPLVVKKQAHKFKFEK